VEKAKGGPVIWQIFINVPNNLESNDTLDNYVLFIFNHSLATMWEVLHSMAFTGHLAGMLLLKVKAFKQICLK